MKSKNESWRRKWWWRKWVWIGTRKNLMRRVSAKTIVGPGEGRSWVWERWGSVFMIWGSNRGGWKYTADRRYPIAPGKKICRKLKCKAKQLVATFIHILVLALVAYLTTNLVPFKLHLHLINLVPLIKIGIHRGDSKCLPSETLTKRPKLPIWSIRMSWIIWARRLGSCQVVILISTWPKAPPSTRIVSSKRRSSPVTPENSEVIAVAFLGSLLRMGQLCKMQRFPRCIIGSFRIRVQLWWVIITLQICKAEVKPWAHHPWLTCL